MMMEMTDKEKELLELFRKVESEKNRNNVIFHTELVVRVQEAFKEDYALIDSSPADRQPA
jgi:hypothetical protein